MGALAGFGSLLKPICLPIPLLILAWWVLSGARWRSLLYACGVIACMALVIAPWTLRNYRTFNDVVLISTNGGYVLYSANNPASEGIHMVVPPPPGETDEVSMDRARSRAAVKWMLHNPGSFLRLALVKSMLVWGTSSTVMSYISFDRMPAWQENLCMAVINVFWAALLVACLVASLTTHAWCDRRLYLAYLFLAYLFALHLVFEAHSRHHVPVLGILALVAAAGLVGIANKEKAVQQATES
jgi:hypothetical protein